MSIETKVREFPGKVLLACYLAEKGFRVVLTNNRSGNEAVQHRAWLYIEKNTFFNRTKFFKKLKRLRVKIACIDEEGIVWANPDIYTKRLSPEPMRMTDLFFTWGKAQSELVTQTGWASKVIETGNPRMDLLRPELRGMYQAKADGIKEKYGDFVLVVSNFAWNNHYYIDRTKASPAEDYIRHLRAKRFITGPEDEEYHRANLAYKAKVFEKLKGLALYLGSSFPECKIIVRPHPSENHEEWKRSIAGLGNVDVVFEGELEAWIMAARAVIHNSCTSGLIAALLNRKSIAYMPYEDMRFEHELPNSVSAKAYSEEEVADLVRKSPIYQDVPDFLNGHISSLSGPFAAQRIADEIAAAYRPGALDSALSALACFAGSLAQSGKGRRQAESSTDAGSAKSVRRNKSRMYKGQKFDSITEDEVADYIGIYRKMLNRFDAVGAREVDGSVEVFFRG